MGPCRSARLQRNPMAADRPLTFRQNAHYISGRTPTKVPADRRRPGSTDPGLGGRLIGMSEERAKDPTAPVGPLLEHFAIGEVARQLTWAEEPVQLFHYHFRGLRHLANRLGDRFRAGIVLYAGKQQLSFGDRLTALPMAALWTLDSSASCASERSVEVHNDRYPSVQVELLLA
jgi:hypothetical protein